MQTRPVDGVCAFFTQSYYFVTFGQFFQFFPFKIISFSYLSDQTQPMRLKCKLFTRKDQINIPEANRVKFKEEQRKIGVLLEK